jgi:hypothetical protein
MYKSAFETPYGNYYVQFDPFKKATFGRNFFEAAVFNPDKDRARHMKKTQVNIKWRQRQ